MKVDFYTNGYTNLIEILYDELDDNTCNKITYMALVHAGFQNMLEDYLLKCGVSIYDISLNFKY